MVIRFVLGWYRMQLSVNGAKFLPSFRLNIDKGSCWIQDLSYHTSNFMPKKKQVTLILSCVSVRLQVLSSVCTPFETTWLHVMRMFFIF